MTPHNASICSIRDREFKAEMEFAAALLFSLIFDAGFGCAVRRGRRGCSGRVESCCGCVCEAGAPLAKCNGLYYQFFLHIFYCWSKRGGWFLCRISKKWNKYILWLIRQDGT